MRPSGHTSETEAHIVPRKLRGLGDLLLSPENEEPRRNDGVNQQSERGALRLRVFDVSVAGIYIMKMRRTARVPAPKIPTKAKVAGSGIAEPT